MCCRRWFGGYYYRRNIAEAKVAKAEDAVKQMIDAAQKRAETIKKETILEAKEESTSLKARMSARTGKGATRYREVSAGFSKRKRCLIKR